MKEGERIWKRELEPPYRKGWKDRDLSFLLGLTMKASHTGKMKADGVDEQQSRAGVPVVSLSHFLATAQQRPRLDLLFSTLLIFTYCCTSHSALTIVCITLLLHLPSMILTHVMSSFECSPRELGEFKRVCANQEGCGAR